MENQGIKKHEINTGKVMVRYFITSRRSFISLRGFAGMASAYGIDSTDSELVVNVSI